MESRAFIGDIHGCSDALRALLALIGPRRVVSLGDVIHRGPDAEGCIALLREIDADVLLGNHEDRHFGRLERPQESEDWRWLQRRCTPYLRFRDHDVLAVHGGLHAGLSPEEHRKDAICRVELTRPGARDRHSPRASWRRDPLGAPELHGGESAEVRNGWRWWTEFLPPGSPVVVYGHAVMPAPLLTYQDGFRARHAFATDEPVARRELVAVGLDTGACLGGRLSALLLPEWRIVSVPGLVRQEPS